VDELIGLTPYVLPIINEEPATPAKIAFATDPTRRIRVDDLLEKLAWSEWERLFRALPARACELELLARALDRLRDRFEEEEEQHQAELGACFGDYYAQRARGVKDARLLLLAAPERRVYREELELIRSCLASVVERLDQVEHPSAVKATLDLIPRGNRSPRLIRFLAGKPERKARLKDICKHLYGSIDKKSIENCALLIKRTSLILDDRKSPLRLIKDRDEVKLIFVDST
jgi:hypothetical protein